MDSIKLFKQSSIQIQKLYFDPYKIDHNNHDAEYVFITHSHYDHFDLKDLEKVININTVIIGPKDVVDILLKKGFNKNNLVCVEPNKEYQINDIKFKTVYSYNSNKSFHPKENGWVGYLLYYNNLVYYIPGDTDANAELYNLKCDVMFVPIGGKYTMDIFEAAHLVNAIKPDIVIPIHYGFIVGNKTLGENFKSLINPPIKVLLINCY